MARWIWNHTQENDCLQLQLVLTCNVVYSHTVINKQMLRDNKEGDQDEEGIDIEEEEE